MVQHVSQYKFEACYAYDNAFRLIIQSERNMPYERRTHKWHLESDQLRNKYLFNNPISICNYCKTPGHAESECKAKKHNIVNKTQFAFPPHIQTQPVPLMSQQFSPRFSPNNASTFPASQFFKPRNSQFSFRASQNANNNQESSTSVHPSRKPCWRYNSGATCYKPPCMFLHACELCGKNGHGHYMCPDATSTNFIPLSGP